MTDKQLMSRAGIGIAIITCMLAFLSPCLAASDAEIVSLSDKMSAAFKCSTYASLFHDQKEQQRLFEIGLKTGRDYVEALKTRDDPTSEMSRFIRGVSTDFVVGQMYESESTHTYDEIVKYQNGLPLNEPLDAPAAKTQELKFVIAKATALRFSEMAGQLSAALRWNVLVSGSLIRSECQRWRRNTIETARLRPLGFGAAAFARFA